MNFNARGWFVISVFTLFTSGCIRSSNEAAEVFATAFNTYRCECACDITTNDFPGIAGKEVINKYNKLNVCAENLNAAETTACPQKCKVRAQKNINELSHFGPGATVHSCPIASATLVYNNACITENELQAVSPKTATFEGSVDFGRSFIEVHSEDGDHLKTPVKGTISMSMTEGACINQECSIEITSVDLKSRDELISTDNGNNVKSFHAINSGIWKGYKDAEGNVKFDNNSIINISAVSNDKGYLLNTNPETNIVSAIFEFGKPRLTSTSSVPTNAFIIEGKYSDDPVDVKFHFHLWLTNCQPNINAKAICWGGLDSESKILLLTHTAEKLGALKGGDLCEVVKKGENACTAGGTVEFPTFNCGTEPAALIPNTSSIGENLDFQWIDKFGRQISKDPYPALYYMPDFPVNVVVTNEWSKSTSDTIEAPPSIGSCPPPVLRIAPGSIDWDPATVPLTPDLIFDNVR